MLDEFDEETRRFIKELSKDQEVTISLTGKDSHRFIKKAGYGSFSIGTNGISEGDFDVWVNKSDKINWDAFNGNYTGYGYQYRNIDPYGDWPRWFQYVGNDLGFIEWSHRRDIEGFEWFPQKNIKADFTQAKIGSLRLFATKYEIELTLGEGKLYKLELCGNLQKYKIIKCDKVPQLIFNLDFNNTVPLYSIPTFEALKEATEVHIFSNPLSSPFDCTCLRQFPNLKKIFFIGNVTNLEVLSEFKNIEKLGFWDAPRLENVPKLTNWKNLTYFVAMNVDKNAGLEFRKELSSLRKTKKDAFLSVSKLREEDWFLDNYGIPFREWEKNERKATRNYKICLNEVLNAKNINEIKEAVISFVKKMNQLEDIETQERDDIFTALCMIMKKSPIMVPEEEWMSWFDEVREF